MKKLLTTFCILVFVSPVFVSAHGAGFESLIQEVDGYVIDFGYDPSSLAATNPTRFSFEIFDDSSTTTLSDFTDVWVIVQNDEHTFFSSGIDRVSAGDTGMAFTFATNGVHEVKLRFQKDDEILAAHTFELDVPFSPDQSSNTAKNILFLGMFIGLFLGFATAFMLKRK